MAMTKNIGDPVPWPSGRVPDSAIRPRPMTNMKNASASACRTPILSLTPPRNSMASVMPAVTAEYTQPAWMSLRATFSEQYLPRIVRMPKYTRPSMT
jgi:hypothetical protein